MAVLFILMAIGVVVGITKILTPEGNKMLSKIVLFIALPCTILSSVFESEASITAADTVYFLLMSLLAFLVAFLIAIPAVHLLGGDKANKGINTFMSVFSNSGFMGFPVVIALFGVSSAYYVAMFNIPFNALVFSVGIFLISNKKTANDTRQLGGFNPKLLINPTLIVALLAIPLALTGIRPPRIIIDAVRITGGITTPGAMLAIGATLTYVPLKTIFSEWRVIPVTLLKLVVIPIATWLVLRHVITNELMLGILVIISGMPTAVMASMFAIEYKGNERIAAAGVFLSTLLCGITVPLIVYLLLM
jgi:hypothetical protein